MALILCIETSTTVCSVALSENGKTVKSLREDASNSHSTKLTILIEELFAESNYLLSNIDAIAVSSGPGSYTGLRIGVSVAKGICFALNKPLISLTSLEIIAAHCANKEIESDALLCPMIDARRMEVYSALFTSSINIKSEIKAEIIDSNSYADELQSTKIYFFGNGSEKCKTEISSPNAIFIDNVFPLAENMSKLCQQKFDTSAFENVAYFEPFYLKDFIAGVSKNKVI